MASVIESVVAPQHTCILLNTTNSLGIESYLEERFPSNVLLSLVCAADLLQVGPTEFEHRGDSSDIWVGWANKNASIPSSIQKDMAEALAMTLTTGGVQCAVSENIRQQQLEKMIGYVPLPTCNYTASLTADSRRPIAFFPTSVIFDTPNHAELLEKPGVRGMVLGVIDELIALGTAMGCVFAPDFRDQVVQQMIVPTEKNSFMYTDYLQKRPMEVETYLGSPIRLSTDVGIQVPRIETLYAMLHYKNLTNLRDPAPSPAAAPAVQGPGGQSLPPRTSSVAGPGPRPVMNGSMPNGGARRAPSMGGPQPGPNVRRGPPNGYGGKMPNGRPPPPGSQFNSRRPSMEGNELQEFSHVMLYDNMNDSGFQEGPYGDPAMAGSGTDLALRERELAMRARELELREREMHMNRRRGPPPPQQGNGFDDDDEDGDFFDPMENRRPNPAVLDDNFDMMSVTSRRTRKMGPPNGNRMNGPPDGRNRNGPPRKNQRSSARLMDGVPGMHDNLMGNALMGYSSNRYGAVDRQAMGPDPRQNSLTRAKLDELQQVSGGSYGGYPTMNPGTNPQMARRASQSPGNPFSPGINGMKRPSPPNGMANGMPNGMQNGMNGRPSPPNGMVRQPVPRHPPGHGNAVAPYQVEQQVGVSRNPLKIPPQVRSLTGSASASAGSGDSANLDSDPSASSSLSSFALGARPVVGVRS